MILDSLFMNARLNIQGCQGQNEMEGIDLEPHTIFLADVSFNG